MFKFSIACEQALHLGNIVKNRQAAPRDFSFLSRVLERIASLAQIRKLAGRQFSNHHLRRLEGTHYRCFLFFYGYVCGLLSPLMTEHTRLHVAAPLCGDKSLLLFGSGDKLLQVAAISMQQVEEASRSEKSLRM